MHQFASRLDGITGSAIRDLFSLLSSTSILSFAGGNPAPETFPKDDLARIAERVLSQRADTVLQYGATEGYYPLRESILQQILIPKGIHAKTSNILPVAGSAQGIDLVARAMINPGDTVLVESPTFLGALQIFRVAQANLVSVPMDGQGVLVDELEDAIRLHHPKVVYTIPTFQNPTGQTLPLDRRQAVARICADYGVLVLEDDPYCDLRYRGEPLPPIQHFDPCGNVVLLNSFSKIISPGLRLGYVVANPELLRKLTIIKQGADTHTSNLSQAVVDEFLRSELLPAHLERIVACYRERLETMSKGIRAYCPDTILYREPEGGLFVWIDLNTDVDAKELLTQAVDKANVAYIPGEHFFVSAADGKHCLRLNFSSSTPKEIEIGMERLGSLLHSACRRAG